MTKSQSSEKICRMDPAAMLDPNAPLFKALANNSPEWWSKLKEDPELYIEIRKGNRIHLYYYGARIAEIEYSKGDYSAKCNEKYIKGDQGNGNIYTSCINHLRNDKKLRELKKNALKFYVQESEGEKKKEKR
ncbi:MAG: hypothetical protein HDS44_02645, partial [Bacteroides sp.]|nr:hypothetical protein [Bacteroides sp.]